jgi:hypothetical protein
VKVAKAVSSGVDSIYHLLKNRGDDLGNLQNGVEFDLNRDSFHTGIWRVYNSAILTPKWLI